MRSADPDSQWTTTHELLASLIEVTDYGNRVLYAVNSRKGAKQPSAVRIPRPGDKKRKPKMASPAEMRQFFGARKKKR